ncbi:hypothetical protein LOTGIDRAFT_234305 [Lottia gigantea]|uniref:OCIA domain-containing protein n=1 Tax=Lottia gigantea TaxID=225164 RepID=V4BLE9_LOTGI|nr:hypothetical protein LOTGIDRAFT_234305 [Lottia gigantea]ESO89464.1 hypothetical protein LOTGIDRAFT_234305 [Lottia gigantea]
MSAQDRQQFDPQRSQVVGLKMKLVLTPEEQAILKECQNESLFYSCLPISFVMGAGTHYLRHLGIIKGRYLGLTVALFTGYFAGKIAYLPKCKKKFETRIPNSTYSQLITGKITQQEYLQITQNEQQAASMAGYPQQYSNTQPDTEGAFNYDDGENETIKQNVTYDELRRKHREQYSGNQPATSKPKFDMQRMGEVDWSKPRMADNTNKGKGKKNQYGDEWDDGK